MSVQVKTAQSTWASRFDELHERAMEQTGQGDFGDTDYHEGLRTLLAALDDSPPPEGPKRAAVEGQVMAQLVSRLHTRAQWQANPGYRDRNIPAPLIVMGVPRTGTTALHNLLSQDPQFQGIEKWLTGAPIVRPPRDTWEDHPQYRAVAAAVARMGEIAPDVMKAHGVYAHEVDECLLPMAQSFTSNWFPSQQDIPLYDRWLLDADETGSFRRYKDILRLIGLNDSRRWLLKNPSHVFGVEAMLAVFPDAIVVQTHRHPAASLASLVNLLDNIMRAYTGEGIDRPRRLARETAFWAEAMRRTMAVQDYTPDRIINIFQPDIRRDPLGVVRQIYEKGGLHLSADAETAMRTWAARNAENTEGGHSYAKIEEEGPIMDAFGPYIERYIEGRQ